MYQKNNVILLYFVILTAGITLFYLMYYCCYTVILLFFLPGIFCYEIMGVVSQPGITCITSPFNRRKTCYTDAKYNVGITYNKFQPYISGLTLINTIFLRFHRVMRYLCAKVICDSLDPDSLSPGIHMPVPLSPGPRNSFIPWDESYV
jgi:hypothetical protein